MSWYAASRLAATTASRPSVCAVSGSSHQGSSGRSQSVRITSKNWSSPLADQISVPVLESNMRVMSWRQKALK